MPTAGILVNKGVSIVVTNGTVTGSTNGNANAAMCGGIYMSEYASLTTDEGLQIVDSGDNDVTDTSLEDPTALNESRKAVIQKKNTDPENGGQGTNTDPENTDPENGGQGSNDDSENTDPANDDQPSSFEGFMIPIDRNGKPEVIFVCFLQGTQIEKIGEPDAAAMAVLSQGLEGSCIYSGSFAFKDALASHGMIRVNFILPEHAGQHVMIATIADGAQVTYDCWVDSNGRATITVDHLGDFAVFLG